MNFVDGSNIFDKFIIVLNFLLRPSLYSGSFKILNVAVFMLSKLYILNFVSDNIVDISNILKLFSWKKSGSATL